MRTAAHTAGRPSEKAGRACRWLGIAIAFAAASPVRAWDYPIVIHRGNGLANVFSRLQGGQSARLAYIGGSITQSPGWRDNVTAWFQSHYPGRITEINAGWGGTGSLIGAMRMARDVLVHSPDLVFIEFAVNDLPEDPLAFVERNCEGMVRQTWAGRPSADLCFIETIAWYSEGPYLSGYYPTPVQAHYNVCDHYGCPSVNVGWALYEVVLAGTPWTSLAPDRVHPNAAGSQIYSDAVIAYLESERQRAGAPADHLLPASRTDFPVMGGVITELADVSPLPPAWSVRTNEFGVSRFIQTSTPGAVVTVPFTGPAAACKIILAPDGGPISYAVDGGAYASANVPLGAGPAPWAFPGAKMLADGPHQLSLRADSGVVRLINVEAAVSGSTCGLDPQDVNLARDAAAIWADSTYGPSWGPERAVDGLTATKWTSTAASAEHWLALDLGRPARLRAFIVRHAGAGGEPSYYNTTAYRIESAAGQAGPWTTILQGANPAQAATTSHCLTEPLMTRFVRLYITDAGIDDYARIPELEVWGRPGRAPMDFDEDDDVDQADFGHLQACLTGLSIPQNAPDCQNARLDGDLDVDAADLELFFACVGGPNQPVEVACLQ